MYGLVPPRLAIARTAAMAFSSQSVMTLAKASAGVPIAIQAPITAAETERVIVQAIEARIFSSMNLWHLRCARANLRATTNLSMALTLGLRWSMRYACPPGTLRWAKAVVLRRMPRRGAPIAMAVRDK